jgi:hypothetical protein
LRTTPELAGAIKVEHNQLGDGDEIKVGHYLVMTPNVGETWFLGKGNHGIKVTIVNTQTFWRNFEVCSQNNLAATFAIVLHARQPYICGCSLSFFWGLKIIKRSHNFVSKLR